MAIAVDPECIMCSRCIAFGSKALFITKGVVEEKVQYTRSWPIFQRFGGKVKPRGVICIECAKQLPDVFHFEE